MDLGQVFTDRAVAAYMASMFEVERDALILDPCFGAGGVLQMLKVMKLIKNYIKMLRCSIQSSTFITVTS